MTHACPNCGYRHRSDGFAADLSRRGLCGTERAVLDRLVFAGGARVTRSQLIHAVYGDDPDGGPLAAYGNVDVFIHRLRRKLRSRGYLLLLAGHGEGWFLRKIGARPDMTSAAPDTGGAGR